MTSLAGILLAIALSGSAPVDLMLHLPFDEGTGNVAYDTSGNGNDALLSGAQWAQVPCGFAVDLDGQDDCLFVQDSGSISALGSATFEIWFRPDSPYAPPPRHQTLLAKWGPGGSGDDEYVIYLYGGVLRFHASGSYDREIAFPTSLLQPSTWHYLAAVVDAADQSIALFLDGVLVVEDLLAWALSRDTDSPLLIGCSEGEPGVHGAWFDGALDEVRIWRRALSAEEILHSFRQHCRFVSIDIKPGSFPNSINLRSNGNVPVAVLGAADLDVSQIDPSSLVFADASVARRNNSFPMVGIEDVNGDAILDLVAHFRTQDLNLSPSSTSAELRGRLVSGQEFAGTDSVRVVR